MKLNKDAIYNLRMRKKEKNPVQNKSKQIIGYLLILIVRDGLGLGLIHSTILKYNLKLNIHFVRLLFTCRRKNSSTQIYLKW